jgi:CubicO group peptidase (beta-lactamase class C family)
MNETDAPRVWKNHAVVYLLSIIQLWPALSSPASEPTKVGTSIFSFVSVPKFTDQAPGWTALFGGETLDGWVQKNGTATYRVVDGTIVGRTAQGSWNSFLCTEKEYGDFELEFDVKVDAGLNSGVQIRSKTRDKTIGKGPNNAAGRVIGPQVEIESSGRDGAEAGYVYSEATGRGWLTPKGRLIPHKHFRDGQWNHYRVVARGPRIRTWINGVSIEDLTDEEAFAEFPRGFIGLQVHRIGPGRGPYEVAWRNIRIRELDVKTERVYFPPPDSQGGWRTAITAEEVCRLAGLDLEKLNDVFVDYSKSTKNGGLLVVRHGWLAFEKYFGYGCRDATPNLGSCGKSFTSIAVGILMSEHPDLFPDGLDQKIFTPTYLPPEAFPLSDPAKAEIKLGQLLAFTAGIRGNNPGRSWGRRVILDPPGPDGWQAMVDAVAVGKRDISINGRNTSTATLWCEPGGGYSYATASAHLASMIVRHVSGMELEPFVRTRLAEPTGWGPFTYAYKHAKEVTHTPGGGGIAVRATDMLRFCYLLLHEGHWQDRQLVPTKYVRHCGRKSPYNPHTPYSLQFDVNSDGHVTGVPRDAFWKTGSGGHVLYIVPSLDLVVWKLAGRDNQYQKSNTGVPMPSGSVKGGKSRRGWKTSGRISSMELLQRIVEAVVTPER